MKRAFVTGGSGFVGGRLTVRGDLDDPAALEAGIRGCTRTVAEGLAELRSA